MSGPAPDDDLARQLWQQLQHALTPLLRRLLKTAIVEAAGLRLPLYLVGGPVRDAYLRQPVTDLDLVVEGDAWTLAEAFAAATRSQLTRHQAFRTAVVEVRAEDQQHAIDVVTARRERYSAPAALPEITPAPIADDLHRRDFTINTLALRLDQDAVRLLDPFGGVADLQSGAIRVLHDASFRDDPTRILRAARFASRLGFRAVPHTVELLQAALAERMIARTSAQRILHELWLTLDEPQPEQTLALLHGWGAFEQLGLVWSDDWPLQFPAARAARWPEVTPHELGCGLLIWPMRAAQRAAFGERYNLPTAIRKLLHELPADPAARELHDLARPELSALELERMLERRSILSLRVLQLVGPPAVAANVARYLDTIRALPPLLSGADLRAAGVPPGPIYRALLAELRQAQLSGSVTTSTAARRWLRERLA